MSSSSSVLAANTYGKSRVRLVRVDRSNPKAHKIFEVTVQVLLTGAFDETYFTGSNAPVVPTDTIKNVVYYVSKSGLTGDKSIEEFGVALCQYFLTEYGHVDGVTAELEQHKWERITDPKTNLPHPIAFTKSQPELRTAVVSLSRKSSVPSIVSGIKGLIVLKTTGSGFDGFPRCKLTTLPETKDRLLCTSVTSTWTYEPSALKSVNFDQVFAGVRNEILDVFANRFANSVQRTVYETGDEVIKKYSAVNEISFILPNIHIFMYDINRFGLTNNGEVYVPIDDPAGNIQGTIRRATKAKL